MIDHVSVVTMAKNAQDTLALSLDSLKAFTEVILYLNDSTDDTEAIAKKYPNVKIIKGEFIGFGETKNKAGEYAKNDWILSLDSDEILTPELIAEISAQNYENVERLFKLKRDNYFLGHKTQNRDHIVRIYNKKHTKFNDNKVHEGVIVSPNSELTTLKNSFEHLNITDINQTLSKMIMYTDLGAKGKKTCYFTVVIIKSMFAFFKTYIIQGNFLRGWVGFAVAINSANKRYYKYLKQFINCKDPQKINREISEKVKP
jgi:glycosyltransferase involved in cell wall biosynthesis